MTKIELLEMLDRAEDQMILFGYDNGDTIFFIRELMAMLHGRIREELKNEH